MGSMKQIRLLPSALIKVSLNFIQLIYDMPSACFIFQRTEKELVFILLLTKSRLFMKLPQLRMYPNSRHL